MNPHDHEHTPVQEAGDLMPSYYEIMETAVRELLVEKRLISAGEIRTHARGHGFSHARTRRETCRTSLGGPRVSRAVARQWAGGLRGA